MKYIEKKAENEPELLKTHKNVTEGVSFKTLYSVAKRSLKSALLREQGYICAYCMRTIDDSNTSIEHFLPQSTYPELSLEYQNLLAVCDGNQGYGKHLLQCDKKKSDKLLENIDPRRDDVEQELFYLLDGSINSLDDGIEHDIDIRLNLNNQRIIENRKVVIDAVIAFIQSNDHVTIKRALKKWKTRNEMDRYNEYCQVGIYFLKKYLKKTT